MLTMYFLFYQLLYESSYNLELKCVLSNSEGHDWVLYMTVLNFDLHCFPIVLNINNALPVYHLLMKDSHNLELKYVQTMIGPPLFVYWPEYKQWFSCISPILIILNWNTCNQSIKTLVGDVCDSSN